MIPVKVTKTINEFSGPKTFLALNFGCRVNSAETNQLSQVLINHGFLPTDENPGIILVNTCAITAKGEYESLSKIRTLNAKYPNSLILATGCADLKKLPGLNNLSIISNENKEIISKNLECAYTTKIADKYSRSHKFILKIQSGCNQFCSYCAVPFRRPKIWSLPEKIAISTVKKSIQQGYEELIITGINLELYHPKVSKLLEKILNETYIDKISFGSLPLNCIDENFIKIYTNPNYRKRLNPFLHIPLQSCSDQILKKMNRPYNSEKIISTFTKLKQISPQLSFGTDIIVGFPGETDYNFQETLNTCKIIGFKKIHTFRFSIRPNTKAELIYQNEKKIPQKIINERSRQIRSLSI